MIASMLALILTLVPAPVASTGSGVSTGEKENKAEKKIAPVRRASRSTVTTRATQKTPSPEKKNSTKPQRASHSKTQAKAVHQVTAPGAEPEATKISDRVIDGVHAFYKDARDLRARFTQKYTYTVYGRTQVSSGRVFFKKPGMMRWDYQKPTPKVFVADGKELWVYEPEENQAFRRKLGSSQLPVALAFMAGTGDLRQEFNITVQTNVPSHFTLELVPKLNEGDYKKVVLTVDRKTYAVQTSTVVDAVGNINRVEFIGMKTNVGLKDQGFNFSPPAGVRVIKD